MSDEPSTPPATVPAADPAPAPTGGLPTRYTLRERIDGGGQGDVFAARDERLGRDVAIKILFHASGLRADAVYEARAEREIRLTARLQHRGIVAVHDSGSLPDGRRWFAMRAVRGQRLDRWLAGLPTPAGGRPADRLRPIVEVLEAACRTLGYAHQEGILHGDLKPANMMVEGGKDVQVLDWGAAIPVGDRVPDLTGVTLQPETGRAVTLTDVVLGTPHYMAPERVIPGRPLGPAADVYAVGVILYGLLAGRLPYTCPPQDVLHQLRFQSPPPLHQLVDTVDRDERDLLAIVDRAMARDAADRHPHGDALAGQLAEWLRVAAERATADEIVQKAEEIRASFLSLRAHRDQALAQAAAAWQGVEPHAPVEQKRPAWALEDEAARLARLADQQALDLEQRLHTAIHRDRHHPQANRALAALYRHLAEDAEAHHRPEEAEALAQRVRRHDQGEHQAWLEGWGRLSLATEPSGARVVLHALELRDRRRRRAPEGRELRPTPLYEVALRRGSYLVHLLDAAGSVTRYPIALPRGGHWDGVPPGGHATTPIRLRPADAGDDCYIPAGWFLSGGDPLAPDSLPATRRWADGFVMARFPVTCGAYLDFLNALATVGDLESARRFAPHEGRGASGQEHPPSAFPEVGGRFTLPDDARFRPDVPVTLVDHPSALAYAAWWAERTGLPWRLPHAFEWEKAARGVDGSHFPWGDYEEPTYANMLKAHAGPPVRTPIDQFPADESIYGVRGLAGNVRDWCLDAYERSSPGVRVIIAPGSGPRRNVRGGAFSVEAPHCRGAARFGGLPTERLGSLGFRLARSVDGG
ncbi:MAG: SUMF1/EgtB/PvdO family nonheme iron enzyme [Myxococcales bacterium]|nr:SUMF1/EgtB/PvdO family nonheme iron enzyme [Myxococcales bacterium]